MKIALLTLGTRGDVQPFAVLGKALCQKGHEVTLASAGNFAPLIESYGIPFVAINADFQEILNSPEGKKMMSNPFSARKHLNRLIYPMMQDALTKFFKLATESDRVLFHVKAMTDWFEEKLNGKLIRANVVPAIEPTSEFVNPILSSLRLPSFLNRVSFRFSDLGMKLMSKPIYAVRNAVGIQGRFKKPELPSIYGISPFFLPQPKDLPRNSFFTGFWIENSSQNVPDDIADFISMGEPPFVITFGSMPFECKMDLTKTLDQLTRELNTRLIVVRGWGLKDTKDLEKNDRIKVVTSLPYDKLFPHIRAAIHHGGIGTIAECLKAGIPFMTCPVLYPLGDQHFWGHLAYSKGIALKPCPLKKMDASSFIKSAKTLLNDQRLQENCRRLSERIKEEDGITNAISIIENSYRG